MPNVTEHQTKTLCPICQWNFANHVHCANIGCTYHITVCAHCDSREAINAFMLDHAKDCAGTQPFVRVVQPEAAA